MRFARPPTWDRSGRQKVSSNRSAVLVRNGHRNGPPVTTTHLFWPNQRRNPAALLPIWQPIRASRRTNGDRGAGGSGAANQRLASIEKGTPNFVANGSPALLCSFKKRRVVHLPTRLRHRRLTHFQ